MSSSIVHIPLEELSLATKGFDVEFRIANGGFGNVYKVESEKYGIIAIKRLNPKRGQGDHEFKTEITLLSEHKHKNIAPLVGFCDEDGEKILVYKYESNMSLDKHLDNPYLTWIQRLRICLDAAQGLQYLHDDVGPHTRILHRDIKSANILLDDKWNAKVSDFGLSKLAPANKHTTFLMSNPCGTLGYIDPDYFQNGYLTKESDVYAFGVVLFEVLCGRIAFAKEYKGERKNLAVWVKIHYKRKTLHEIVYSEIQYQINEASLLTFSKIAYRCLMTAQERPTMKEVIKKLHKALTNQQAPNGSLSNVYVDFGEGHDDDFVALDQQGKSAGSLASPSQSILVASSSSKLWNYDVFISFIGEDTRNTFYDFLCTALVQQGIRIHTYGEIDFTVVSVPEEVTKAIEESQIAIILFSENYASSSWCLDELALIMKNRDEKGQIVLPIYYDVDPSQVRKQSGKFGNAFAKHDLRNNDKVRVWRKALVDAAYISGWNISDREPEWKFIKNIVDHISHEILRLVPSAEASAEASAKTSDHGTDDLIKVETRMKELISLLQVGSGGVHMVGICGIWGSGKSTLASSVYEEINQEFEGCCFLKNVRSESRMHGLKTLQAKILSDVLKSTVRLKSIKQGIHMMERRLRRNSFLIVLDDVNHIDHLKMLAGSPDWFGEGSRIIITTRSQDLANAFTVILHNVRMLDVEEGVKLFSKHAFTEGRLVTGYEEVTRNMVSKVGGHPSALITLGSFLHDINISEWTSILARLEDIPVNDILEKFKPEGDDGVTRDIISWMDTELFSEK